VLKIGLEANATKVATNGSGKLQTNLQTAIKSIDPGEMGKEMIA